jgi:hypothetical protein
LTAAAAAAAAVTKTTLSQIQNQQQQQCLNRSTAKALHQHSPSQMLHLPILSVGWCSPAHRQIVPAAVGRYLTANVQEKTLAAAGYGSIWMQLELL